MLSFPRKMFCFLATWKRTSDTHTNKHIYNWQPTDDYQSLTCSAESVKNSIAESKSTTSDESSWDRLQSAGVYRDEGHHFYTVWIGVSVRRLSPSHGRPYPKVLLWRRCKMTSPVKSCTLIFCPGLMTLRLHFNCTLICLLIPHSENARPVKNAVH